jgi:hypothetical protein
MPAPLDRPQVRARALFVWLVVIGGHALLLALIVREGNAPRQTKPVEVPSVLLLLELPRNVEPQPLKRKDRRRTATVRPDDASSASGAITLPPETSAPAPSIDWYGEADRSVRDFAKDLDHPTQEGFDKRRGDCRKKSSFEWTPEPKRAGTAGGLPYVRLGKKCVLGLGFFGCGLGKAPEANSHLFDDMEDQDEPESSVPALDECD